MKDEMHFFIQVLDTFMVYSLFLLQWVKQI